MMAQTVYNDFKPGELWLDNKGNHINAHGGGFLYYNDTYYWFGEHKESGKMGHKALVGVHVYSSKDLYNWKDEGVALAMSNDTTSMLQKESLLERPKVIYNKWILIIEKKLFFPFIFSIFQKKGNERWVQR